MSFDFRDIALSDLAAENAELNASNAALVELVADLTYQNFLLGAVADYRCRQNPNILNVLTRAAKAPTRTA